jgi:hypothetical protein
MTRVQRLGLALAVTAVASCSSAEEASPTSNGGQGGQSGRSSEGGGGTVDAATVAQDASNGGAVVMDTGASMEVGPPGNWYDPSFTRRRPVIIDARLSSIEGGALTDFPAALVIAAGTIAAGSVRADGGDVRFVDATGRVLARDLEAWDPNANSVVWVALPSVPASAPIYMYYGSPSTAAIATDREAVWKAPYAAVWHFAGKADDATPNHFDGATTQAAFTPGKLGQAAQFSAVKKDHIGLAAGTSLVRGVDAVTESAWVKTGSIDPATWGVVLSVGTAATTGDLSRTSMMIWGKTAKYPFGGQPLYDALYGEINPDEVGGGWEFAYSPTNALPAGDWHYLTVVFDVKGKATTLYIDGAHVGGPLVTPGQGGGAAAAGNWKASAFSMTAPGRIQIGAEDDVSHGYYDGLIDELRVESVARSPQWVAAQAIAASGDALKLGPEEQK